MMRGTQAEEPEALDDEPEALDDFFGFGFFSFGFFSFGSFGLGVGATLPDPVLLTSVWNFAYSALYKSLCWSLIFFKIAVCNLFSRSCLCSSLKQAPRYALRFSSAAKASSPSSGLMSKIFPTRRHQ